MLFKKCHLTVIALLVFQSCTADDPRIISAGLVHNSVPTPALLDKNDITTSTTVPTIVSVATEKSTVTAAQSKVNGAITVPVTVSTVFPDPDPQVETNGTTLTPSNVSTSTLSPTPTTPTTTIQPTVTPHNTSTTNPLPTGSPHHRQFDSPSFIGGIVLATGLMAIGFVAFKFYKARTERNYHTL